MKVKHYKIDELSNDEYKVTFYTADKQEGYSLTLTKAQWLYFVRDVRNYILEKNTQSDPPLQEG